MSTEKKTPEMHEQTHAKTATPEDNKDGEAKDKAAEEKEIGGFKDAGLPEPTRFGDWEVKGRCSDF
jgi:hypothetical protein